MEEEFLKKLKLGIDWIKSLKFNILYIIILKELLNISI
jgi:hypothetical protein